MRCREGEGGPVVREQELQHGKFMGVVRYFKDGALEKEYRVNERGNRDGLAREWSNEGGKHVLVREETERDSHTVGLARSWYPSGVLRRVTFYGDDEREQAYAEFTMQGQLYELRCAPQPVLGKDFDDRAACGFAGAASSVVSLLGQRPAARSRELRARHAQEERDALGQRQRARVQETIGRRHRQERSPPTARCATSCNGWPSPTAGPAASSRSTASSTSPASSSASAAGAPASAAPSRPPSRIWYLNGQPKAETQYVAEGGRTLRREVEFHDNGKKAFEGSWLVGARGGRDETATGTHRSFDAEGRLRAERVYDERGRIRHEREIDERGNVVRDDEVFEDGSRKAVGR